MKRVIPVVLCVGFSGFLAASEPKAADAQMLANKALESFADTWEIVSVKPEGTTKEARRLLFRKDGTYAALDKNDKELWAGTFEINPNATPKVWDHRTHEGKKKGSDVLGIYELNGDTLKVSCVVGIWKGKEWVGKPRPKSFDLKEADVTLELRRVKAAKP